jgi:hypothetical protein
LAIQFGVLSKQTPPIRWLVRKEFPHVFLVQHP